MSLPEEYDIIVRISLLYPYNHSHVGSGRGSAERVERRGEAAEYPL